MHDVLRQRLMRTIESLPDEQIYQVLDYIEFLEAKYAEADAVEASGLQKFAEGFDHFDHGPCFSHVSVASVDKSMSIPQKIGLVIADY